MRNNNLPHLPSCQQEHLWCLNNPEKRTREELTRSFSRQGEYYRRFKSHHRLDCCDQSCLFPGQVIPGTPYYYVAISVAVKLLALGPDHCSWLILSTTAGLPCFRAMSPDLKWGTWKNMTGTWIWWNFLIPPTLETPSLSPPPATLGIFFCCLII